MNPQTRMLVWAEFRQRRAQLLLGLIWMVGGSAYAIAYELSARFRAPVATFDTVTSLYGLAMPIFLAMRTSLGEATDHTRAFSDGLPISPRRRGWVRLAGGAAVLVLPIIVGALLLSACLATGWLEQAPPRMLSDMSRVRLADRASLSPLLAVGLVYTVTAVVAWWAMGLYLVLSLFGTALQTESHLGYAGAAIAVVWFLGGALELVLPWIGLSSAAQWIGAIAPQATVVNFSYGDAHGSYGDLAIAENVLMPLAINALLQVGIAVLFVRRYSRRQTGRSTDATPRRSRRLRLPRLLPTRGFPLAWLALRQSVPMCLPGLVIAGLMTPFQMDSRPDFPQEQFLGRYSDALPSSMWIVGILWSVVVGAGIFSAEIDGRIGEFWRTRPIPAWRLFAVKFVLGLLAVLLVLDGAAIAANWRSPNWGDYRSMNWSYVACFLPLHATMFSIAVAWTCALRRPVIGGMAAIGTFTLTEVALEWSDMTRQFSPIEVYNNMGIRNRVPLGGLDFVAHGYPLVAGAMGLVIAASFAIGWLALRRYDPRRQAL